MFAGPQATICSFHPRLMTYVSFSAAMRNSVLGGFVIDSTMIRSIKRIRLDFLDIALGAFCLCAAIMLVVR